MDVNRHSHWGTLTTVQIAWMDGVTMGGGCGVSINGAIRIATENTVSHRLFALRANLDRPRDPGRLAVIDTSWLPLRFRIQRVPPSEDVFSSKH